MTKMIIHNAKTQEIIERDMNPEELAEWQKQVEKANNEKIELANKKALAEAKLTALGLTIDDLNALGF